MKEIVTAEGVSKVYRIGVQEKKSDTMLGAVWNGLKAPLRNFKTLRNLRNFNGDGESVFWALKDINFTVEEGEVLGVIGHNGAGKSTLLKVLSRITDPTSGRILIRGRVSALLEVGTGFHPDLTGRENIYMNGSILGMRRKEIDSKFEEIVEFSGISKHIDTPVKRYSSGMTVRLAFSVAAHLEPEILVIDEVLAVGDAEFQNRCLNKMNDVATAGRTVLFVSHNMAAVRSLCSRAIVLNGGCIEYNGAPEDAIEHYLTRGSTAQEIQISNGFVLESLQIDFDGSQFQSGNSLTIRGLVKGACKDEIPYIILSINSLAGERILLLSSRLERISISKFDQSLEFVIKISDLNLMPNNYLIDLRLLNFNGKVIAEWIKASEFEVVENDKLATLTLPSTRNRGILYCNSDWSIKADRG